MVGGQEPVKFMGSIMEFVTFYLNTTFAISAGAQQDAGRSWSLGAGWDPHILFFFAVETGLEDEVRSLPITLLVDVIYCGDCNPSLPALDLGPSLPFIFLAPHWV